MRRYLLLVFLGLTVVGLSACDTMREGVDSTLNVFSNGDAGPAQVVRDAYAYQVVPGSALPPPWATSQRQKFFSKRMVTMFLAHEQPGPDGKPSLHFEFDPFINAEEAEVTDFDSSLAAEDESTAQVRATFRNKGKPTTLIFVLVEEEEGWRIDDVKSLDNDPKWVLSSLLKT